MKKTYLGLALLFIAYQSTLAQSQPTVNEGEPVAQLEWELVPELSDEFGGRSLDEDKWINADPNGWRGRAPGLFKANTVSVKRGKLSVTTYKLDESEEVNGKEFTHAGGHIQSNNPAAVGQYFECRMKANKTFMSSTFWLINDRSKEEGCDKRVTELDIQESVGQITTDAEWAQDFNTKMNSNTHSRHVVCNEPEGIKGNKAKLPSKVYNDYHVFGAWWKSPKEIQFYMNGKHVGTVEPAADFDIPMYLKMVIETYDWNPVPEDGGMNMKKSDRTTYYDWVRTWRPVNQ
uniref:MS132, putative beta-agarase n=1 Tax=Microscilla sp. PRE1 TaxID=155537 RepID=Q93P99_9BACT|nr:MS132 beta-agarase [Microscilla sp. PRE1]AAK62854.1 MS132, putative beta-agarase [Microscilla sp. PRE1]